MRRNFPSLNNRRLAKSLFLFAAALSAASCAVSSPLSIESAGEAVSSQAIEVALILPKHDAPALRRSYAAALTDALQARQIAVTSSGNLLADYAVSNGTAELGVRLRQDRGTQQEGDPKWISVPRPSRRFDECEARALRGTLVLLDRSSGTVIYRGQAMMTECAVGEPEIEALAQALVTDFLSTGR